MNQDAIEKDVCERFVRYVQIYTTSDRHSSKVPTTDNQWDLLKLLKAELTDLGMSDIELDDKGFLFARLPGSKGYENLPYIGLMAHVDTAEDAPGENIKPQLHEQYDGNKIVLKEGITIDPQEEPELLRYVGKTVITTDGTTLLGADDKAGVAEIMTMLVYLKAHPDFPHPPLEIIFTPDEETGAGMDRFPLDKVRSKYAYTMDAGEEGEIEAECYTAYYARVSFKGIPIHPGYARGRLVNSISMAIAYMNMIPRSESPEATDGRFGNYWAQTIQGSVQNSFIDIYIRDFNTEQVERRVKALESFARATEAAFPGGVVTVEAKKQYLNMKDELDKHPLVMDKLRKALENAGVEAKEKSIRGGTDGARLTELGVPCPNVFAGGHNFHSCKEWVGLPTMVKSVDVLLELIKLWTEK
ncbi:peptidase T [Spirochaeta cellobiosiphila]|uniref:peptidase T n=1 Tax=Spirochaeta cellobiosiphila TaxID=504483 RepID=UPI000404EA06|nr:peptidase T [Spirochaeta cellobiosiphila]